MSKYKKNIIVFLSVLIALIILNTLFEESLVEDLFALTNIFYWLAMSWGIFIAVYALKIRCPKCHSGQVFRGISAFDIRWPNKKCFKCNEYIE